jgi:UDP-N-acetylmuramate dehydrogenase
VGGPARWFARATTKDDLARALEWADRARVPVLCLGGGSNVLFADRGFDGLVIRIEVGESEVSWHPREGEVRVGAGHDWDKLVLWAVERDLAGLECLAGIPGLAGATPIQNVGAYGQEIGDTLRAVEVMDRGTGETKLLAREACGLRYRDSAFKRELRGRYVITEVRFALVPGGAPTIAYPELQRHLDAKGTGAKGRSKPTLAAVRDSVITLRRSKSMVLDKSDENHRSAGSFFMNPIVPAATAEDVKRRWITTRTDDSSVPEYAAESGVKLSAAWLIERSGYGKGRVRGEVGISTKHSLAIVNRGGATASAVVSFAREVREAVRTTFGVTLHPEPELIGFEFHEIGDLCA